MHVVEPCMPLELAAATAVCWCLATDWHFVLTGFVVTQAASNFCMHSTKQTNTAKLAS